MVQKTTGIYWTRIKQWWTNAIIVFWTFLNLDTVRWMGSVKRVSTISFGEYRPCCLSSWMLSVALLCFRMVTSDSKLVEVIFPHKFRGKLERRDMDKEKSPSPTNSNWPRKGRFILKLGKTCATYLPNVNFYFHFLFWILLSRTLIWIIKMYVEQSTTKRIFIYNCRQNSWLFGCVVDVDAQVKAM